MLTKPTNTKFHQCSKFSFKLKIHKNRETSIKKGVVSSFEAGHRLGPYLSLTWKIMAKQKN